MDARILDRNCRIIKDNLVSRMNKLLDVMSDLLNSELSGGFGLFFKTAFKFLYRNLVQSGIRRDAEKSIDGIIAISRRMVENGTTEDQSEFDEILENGFPTFLKNESISRLGKKRHKNFPRVEEELRRLFRWYIVSTVSLLVEDSEIDTYPELYRAGYPTKKDGFMRENEQFDIIMQMLSIVEEDLSILSVPVSRKLMYNVLMKGYLRTIDKTEREIEEIYS